MGGDFVANISICLDSDKFYGTKEFMVEFDIDW